MYVNTDETGRIVASTFDKRFAGGMFEFNFDDDFDFSKQNEYIIKDGALVYAPLPELEEKEIFWLIGEKGSKSQIETAMSLFVSNARFDDETALSVSELYPEWKPKTKYKTGDIRKHNGFIYRAIEDSIGDNDNAPDVSTKKWRKI